MWYWIGICCSECINTFWSGVIGTVWHKKSKNEKFSLFHKDFLNYTNFSYITFFFELCWNCLIFHIIYWLPKLHTIWLMQFFFITHPNSFIFNLTYTTGTSLISWLNSKSKKLLKCLSIPIFLHTNLNHKNAKMVLMSSLYLFATETYKSYY